MMKMGSIQEEWVQFKWNGRAAQRWREREKRKK